MHCTTFHQHILFDMWMKRDMAQKNSDAIVEDYMTINMVTISQKQTVLDIAKLMVERRISSVALTDDKDNISGILTERDIVKVMTNALPADGVTGSSLMTHPVISISKESPIENAARTMVQKHLRHLLVEDPSDHSIVGIITVTDLARYLRQNLAKEEIASSDAWELFF